MARQAARTTREHIQLLDTCTIVLGGEPTVCVKQQFLEILLNPKQNKQPNLCFNNTEIDGLSPGFWRSHVWPEGTTAAQCASLRKYGGEKQRITRNSVCNFQGMIVYLILPFSCLWSDLKQLLRVMSDSLWWGGKTEPWCFISIAGGCWVMQRKMQEIGERDEARISRQGWGYDK